jgi:hypothetical protein
MAQTKRKQLDSAGQPTISVRAERTAQSSRSERLLLRRRIFTLGLP